ncbi:MAG: DUF2974 domain-containing protein [Oscillospiraceae bacterium]|nr:DUF2974 domain-containing protein [Oscillospiraceae bacterium]
MSNLSNFQIERLCNITYLDVLISEQTKNNLNHIMRYMLDGGFDEVESLPVLMSRPEWEQVARSITEDPILSGFFVVKYENDEKNGSRVFCFADGNPHDSHKAHGEIYVVFRGTCGDVEWYDNARGMFVAETRAQTAALSFVREVREEFPTAEICVAGHSKGGNKAQYCAIVGGEIVKKCLSIDGQGFSHLFFEKYGGIIEEAGEIAAISERRDFVNCLGFYLKTPEYYAGGRGDTCEKFPFGQPLPYFHCPDALRLKDGDFGDRALVSYISKALNSFVIYFLTAKKYSGKAEKIAYGLVSLMTADRHGKQAVEAIAEAALIFFELAAKDESFRGELRDVFVYEKDVISATSQMLRENIKGNEIVEHASKTFAEKLTHKPKYFRYFIQSVERYVVFTRKVQKAKENAGHINHYIKGIFKHINQKSL